MEIEERQERDIYVRFGATVVFAAAVVWVIKALQLYYLRFPFHSYFRWLRVERPAWLRALDISGMSVQWAVVWGLVVTVWTAWACTALGTGLYRNWKPEADHLERWTAGGGIGLTGLGVVTMLAGFVGLWRWAAFVQAVVLLGFTVGGVVLWRQNRAKVQCDKEGVDCPICRALGLPQLRPWHGILFSVMVLVQGLALLYALTPSTQSDALRYHLAGPQEWLKAGGLVYQPYNSFTCFPSLVEMLFLHGMALGGDLAAKAMHFLFLPLTAGAAALLTRRMGGGQAAQWGAAAIWGTAPIAVIIAGWAFIDLAVTFYAVMMVYYLSGWLESQERCDWILAACFGGGLVASKYTGVPMVFVAAWLLVMMVWLGGRSKGKPYRVVWVAFYFGLLAAAFGAPWWLRNIINTGNPVYPLAWGVFGGGEWTQTAADIYSEKLGSKGIGRTFEDFLRIPWDTFMSHGKFGGFKIGPVFWVFWPLALGWVGYAFYSLRRKAEWAYLAVWMIFLLVFWFNTYQSNRFLMPLIMLVIAAAMALLQRVCEATRRRRLTAWVAAVLLSAVALFGASESVFWLLFDEGRISVELQSGVLWPAYTLGGISRDQYLSNFVGYYEAARIADLELDEGDKVFFIGEHRRMHWQVDVMANDWYDPPRILSYLRQSETADEVLDTLRAEGVTHLFINRAEWGWQQDAELRRGDKPFPPGNSPAWAFKLRYFERGDVLLLEALLRSGRLRPVWQGRGMWLVEIGG